jgi:hypothetical protein
MHRAWRRAHLTHSGWAVTLTSTAWEARPMSDKVKCPACGKGYRWNPELAGRKVKCKCGEVFRMAAPPGSVTPASNTPVSITDKTGQVGDGYDLHDTGVHAPAHGAAASSASSGGDHCPSCNQPVKAGAVICINCGFNLKSGQRVQTCVEPAVETDDAPASAAPVTSQAAAALSGGTSKIAKALDAREDDTTAPKWKDIYLPAALIVLGVGMAFVQAMYFSNDATQGLTSAAMMVGLNLAFSVPALFIAMLLAVKILDVAFGPLGMALFKLVAIALGPDAIGGIINVAVGGGIVGWFAGFMVSLIAFWVLLTVLLDLEAIEALYMMGLIWIVQYITGFLVLVMIGSLFA